MEDRGHRPKYIDLYTQQRRLRHLRSISARNLSVNMETKSDIGWFFTLHLTSSSKAFYTSEKIMNDANPNWTNISTCQLSEDGNLSSPSIIVIIWASVTSKTFPVLDWNVSFNGLTFISEKISKLGNGFVPNTLVFNLGDGYFSTLDSLCPSSSKNLSLEVKEPEKLVEYQVQTFFVKKSYTPSALQRVHTVQRATIQTKVSVSRLRAHIHRKLDAKKNQNESGNITKEDLRLKINLLNEELKRQRFVLEEEKKAVEKLKTGVHSLDDDLLSHCHSLRKDADQCREERKSYINMREDMLKINAHLTFRRKQLISGLSFIYPIQELPGKGFTINGIHLPNSEDFSGQDETMIAVALGYVCHLIGMISQFLHVPLRYPVKHQGSKSKISDHILEKLPDSEREFPLYSKGKDKLQFNYGVYLLNKNIAQLRFYCGLTTHDLRATLPNLYSLLELRLGVKPDQPMIQLGMPSTLSGGAVGQQMALKDLENLRSDSPTSTIQAAANMFEESRVTPVNRGESPGESPPRGKRTPNNLLKGDELEPHQQLSSGALSCSLDQGLNKIEQYQRFSQSSYEIDSGGSSESGGVGCIQRCKPGGATSHRKSLSDRHGSDPVLLSYARIDREDRWSIGDSSPNAGGAVAPSSSPASLSMAMTNSRPSPSCSSSSISERFPLLKPNYCECDISNNKLCSDCRLRTETTNVAMLNLELTDDS